MMSWKSSKRFVTAFFFLCSGPLALGTEVKGIEGELVTLTCNYKVKTKGDITTMCWGRGSCPNSKCTEPVINTDGYKVTYRSEDRYQLRENIRKGQVSLTIMKARMEDQGTYCCRVEHPGLFNDLKLNIQLKVGKAPPTTPPTTTLTTTTAKRTLPPSTTISLITTTHRAITELEHNDLTTGVFPTLIPDDALKPITDKHPLETTGVTIFTEFTTPITAQDEFLTTTYSVPSSSQPTTEQKHTSVETKSPTATSLENLVTYDIITELDPHDPIPDGTTFRTVDAKTVIRSSIIPITESNEIMEILERDKMSIGNGF
uniref:Ig-like domain-containing protein n=1 Tax=Leptobrachium leishanense TaxID=445787 RepID=A0A8C5M7N1_9ANUR